MRQYLKYRKYKDVYISHSGYKMFGTLYQLHLFIVVFLGKHM